MLLAVFNEIKTKLTGIDRVQLIDWFNNQYEGTIHAEPALFIEFPESLVMQQLNDKYQQALLTIRIHTVSKVLSAQDGSIDASSLQLHEAINRAVYLRLQGVKCSNDITPVFSHLSRVRYEHFQHDRGWMLTLQDFETIVYIYPETEVFGQFEDVTVTSNQ